METKRVLVISDNEELLKRFLLLEQVLKPAIKNSFHFQYTYSYLNKSLAKKFENENWIKPLNVKDELDWIIKEFEIVFSIHCKQLFPKVLVKKVRCYNIHPGFNPHNRGWFPQVFSIINGLPCGATIHEIDEELDHGCIICQKIVNLEKHDTSLTAYNKILDVEIELLSENLENILLNNYIKIKPEEGNLNLKKDFNELCCLNLKSIDTLEAHINLLRALSHGTYKNAYFIDETTGKKIFVNLNFQFDE